MLHWQPSTTVQVIQRCLTSESGCLWHCIRENKLVSAPPKWSSQQHLVRSSIVRHITISTTLLFSTTMTPQSKGKSSKYFIELPSRASWREDGMNGSPLILTIVKEAATHAPFVQLKQAACVTLIILQTIQVWTLKNHGTYHSTPCTRTDFTVNR